jgi:hypothetical protein
MAEIQIKRAESRLHKLCKTRGDTLGIVSIVGLCTSDGSSCVKRRGPVVLDGSEIETRLSPIQFGVRPDPIKISRGVLCL